MLSSIAIVVFLLFICMTVNSLAWESEKVAPSVFAIFMWISLIFVASTGFGGLF